MLAILNIAYAIEASKREMKNSIIFLNKNQIVSNIIHVQSAQNEKKKEIVFSSLFLILHCFTIANTLSISHSIHAGNMCHGAYAICHICAACTV